MVRSGLVFGGKIYETDGANPVAVHEAADVRPLAPIPHAPTLRIFHSEFQSELLAGEDPEGPAFFFGNPQALGGASSILPYPEWSTEVAVLPTIAVVIAGDVPVVDLEDADETILGYTMLLLLVAKDSERRERRIGAIGTSHNLGGVIGPVMTTPDELEEEVEDAEFGRRFSLATSLRVNGVEKGKGSVDEVGITFAQAISACTQGSPLRAGDLIALGPVVTPDDPIYLEPGDEVSLAIEKLGTLSLKVAVSS